jgi:hypothetical protein
MSNGFKLQITDDRPDPKSTVPGGIDEPLAYIGRQR